jgi:hypothetical protein
VPEDVGFCLVIEDLRDHGRGLLESPFFKQFCTSPVGSRIIAAQETEKLSKVDKFLQKYLKINSATLRDEILGDALVVAYRPGPPANPEREQGLFLIRARDAKLLAGLLERVNKLQKESGDLKELQECTLRGTRYYRRVEPKQVNFCYLRGPVFAFATDEGILRAVIDRDSSSATEAEPPLAREFRLLGVEKTLASVWINPRAFEPALQQKAAGAKGAQAVALRKLLAYWKALDGAAIAVGLGRDLDLSLVIRAKTDKLPAAARRFLAAAAKPSEAWSRFPADSILAVAGRIDIAALTDLVSDFLTDDARKPIRAMIESSVGTILGRDFVGDLLPSLGPDWGFCVGAPPAGSPAWFPQVVGVLRVRPTEKCPAPQLVLSSALNALATLAVYSHNQGRPGSLSLKATAQDDAEIKYLVNEEQFPPGLEPAFALKEGYLVLASSPGAIQRFHADQSETTRYSSPGGDVFLLRLSVRELHRFLRERRQALISYASAKKQISAETASHMLDSLMAGLQLFDHIELRQSQGPERATFTLRIQMACSLK